MQLTVFAVVCGVIFFTGIIYNNQKNKKKMVEKLNKEFGEKPEDDSSDLDMGFLKRYYKTRRENEKSVDCIDEITWNDLDMDSVFKRINYTNTTLGETYLYYKLRNVQYDKSQWNDIEKLINIFMEDNNIRNQVKLNMMKAGKFNNDRLLNFIYNPSFILIKGYFKYPVLSLCLLVSIITAFISVKIGLPLTIVFMTANALIYNSEKISLTENCDVMEYLVSNINLYAKLGDIKDSSFAEFSKAIKDNLKRLKEINKIRLYSLNFSKRGVSIANDFDFLSEYIKMFFMTDIITYQHISKLLDKNKDYLYDIYDFIAKTDFALSIAYYRKSLD